MRLLISQNKKGYVRITDLIDNDIINNLLMAFNVHSDDWSVFLRGSIEDYCH